MRILPVLDLKGSHVVRAVAGRRDDYRPWISALCGSSDPVTIALAMTEIYGLAELYVADLDAIGGAPPDFEMYERLLNAGMRLCIDAGLRGAADVREMTDFIEKRASITGIVAALESVDSREVVAELVRAVGPQRAVFSLDLANGQPLTSSSAFANRSAPQIVEELRESGIERWIVLDLAQVGTGGGPAESVLQACRELRAIAPHAEIIAGGGVRQVGDLQSLARAGCDAALVASALHEGAITRQEIEGLAGA
ncbi:MAG: HisA/HisF-related TIM barrel protein [Pirellulales bacterium]